MSELKVDWLFTGWVSVGDGGKMNRFAISLGGLAAAISLVCVMPFDWPPLNIVRFAAVPVFYAVIMVLVLLLSLRKALGAVLAATGALILVVGLWPVLCPLLDRPEPGVDRVRILFANMNYANPTPKKLFPTLKSEAPDLVVLVESSPQERAMFDEGAFPQYPYRFFYGETHLLSKYPFDNLGYEPIGHTSQGFLVETPNGTINLQVVHLSRPWPYASLKDGRNNAPGEVQQLIARLQNGSHGNMLMVGDFNATANSSLISQLRKGLKLRVLPTPVGTWPAKVVSPFAASFDNVLAGGNISLIRRRVGNDIGSDHRPVIVDVQLADEGRSPRK
jgi:endonuclease/exonuclease/phosphatase (EEP) superfamily protein YafD